MELRLIYFNFPFWRAEASRIALHLAGIPFEDVRPDREAFAAMKASGELPYGQLPVLDVDGVRIAQSVAIARFCGKVAGMYPVGDDVAAAQVDELLDTATQITGLFGPSMREKNEEKKAAMRETLATVTLPAWLAMIEKRLSNSATGQWFVGAEMTIADLVIWRMVGWLKGGALDGIPGTLVDGYSALSSHFERVDAYPGVREWMASHYPKWR